MNITDKDIKVIGNIVKTVVTEQLNSSMASHEIKDQSERNANQKKTNDILEDMSTAIHRMGNSLDLLGERIEKLEKKVDGDSDSGGLGVKRKVDEMYPVFCEIKKKNKAFNYLLKTIDVISLILPIVTIVLIIGVIAGVVITIYSDLHIVN